MVQHYNMKLLCKLLLDPFSIIQDNIVNNLTDLIILILSMVCIIFIICIIFTNMLDNRCLHARKLIQFWNIRQFVDPMESSIIFSL